MNGRRSIATQMTNLTPMLFSAYIHQSSAVLIAMPLGNPGFRDSEKRQSLISANWSLAITASTSGSEKLPTVLQSHLGLNSAIGSFEQLYSNWRHVHRYSWEAEAPSGSEAGGCRSLNWLSDWRKEGKQAAAASVRRARLGCPVCRVPWGRRGGRQ